MFPRNETRNEGTFACSTGTKTGTRVHSPEAPFCETALLSPSDQPQHACVFRTRSEKNGQNVVDLSCFPCFVCEHLGTLLSNSNFYKHLGHTKRGGVTMTLLVPFFSSIWVSWDPQTLQNKGNTNYKLTLFTPHMHSNTQAFRPFNVGVHQLAFVSELARLDVNQVFSIRIPLWKNSKRQRKPRKTKKQKQKGSKRLEKIFER